MTVKYERRRPSTLAVPVELIVDAGARVSLIAKTMGLAKAEDLENVLAGRARRLSLARGPPLHAPRRPRDGLGERDPGGPALNWFTVIRSHISGRGRRSPRTGRTHVEPPAI